MVHHLTGLIDRAEHTSKHGAQLNAIIDLSFQVEQQLKSACERVRDIQFEPLDEKLQRVTGLKYSFIPVYEYFLSHNRAVQPQSPPADVLNRLRYVRFCTLVAGLNLLSRQGARTQKSHPAQTFFDLYIKFSILDARLRGKLSAFEGLRILKEPANERKRRADLSE